MSPFPAVASLVPHRPPMLLIDRVTASSERGLTAEVRISPQAPFFEAPIGVPAWIALEYMGQAAAAYFSLQARARAPTPGMLIGCRHLNSTVAAFPDGAVLRVSVEPASALTAALVRFRGEIHMRDRVADGELSVYMAPRA